MKCTIGMKNEILFQFYSDKINKLSTKKTIYEEKISELKRSIKTATKNIDTLEKAQAFIQKVAQDTQSQLQKLANSMLVEKSLPNLK